MGTNFYARRIPTKEEREHLSSLVFNVNNSSEIIEEAEELFKEWHLGKRSGGWKFLWDTNITVKRNGHAETEEIEPGHTRCRWIPEPDTLEYLYPLTKEGIWNFINQENIAIYDEYNELQDKKEFFQMALDWITWRGEEAHDAASYEKENPNKFPLNTDLTKLLIKEGYEFTTPSHSDFYSDGLRFAGFTDFS